MSQEQNAGVGVRFYEDAYRNEAKSTEAGHPVFDTVDWCEIKVLAERDTVCGPVNRMHPDPRVRFSDAWAAYLRDKSTEGLTGMPLKEVAWLGKGEVETLKHAGIKTLEQLAQVSDANVTKIPGGLALRKKAQEMLKAAADSAPLQTMTAELARRDEEIAALKASMQEILEANRKKKAKE